MFDAYSSLADWYDSLTGDIPYEEFADFYESVFKKHDGEFNMLLDLCCGTGTLTYLLSKRGYDMIGADASEDMLIQAREKVGEQEVPPLFVCQDATELDLYGTVDATVCSLDGINYIEYNDLSEVFRRLRLFIRPDGLFIFDIKTPESFEQLDGQVYYDESNDRVCLWTAEFDYDESIMYYGIDVFSRVGDLWERNTEEHIEYAHTIDKLVKLLGEYGFEDIEVSYDGPQADKGRVFIISKRGQ